MAVDLGDLVKLGKKLNAYQVNRRHDRIGNKGIHKRLCKVISTSQMIPDVRSNTLHHRSP
jgi:hypothetical protein